MITSIVQFNRHFRRIPFYMLVVLSLLFALAPIRIVNADINVSAKCGDIIDEAFTSGGEWHYFFIDLDAGDVVWVDTKAVGNNLKIQLDIEGPAPDYSNNFIAGNYATDPNQLASNVLSAQGIYRISLHSTVPGSYTVDFGCFHDGKTINPGDNANITPTPTPSALVPTATQGFSGVGFPGIAAVDFSNVSSSQLPSDGKIEGQIKPTSSQIIAFTFNAKANDNATLDFVRKAGNLNLELVVLSPDSKVIFQASLVTTQTFSTQLILPSSGDYTIGIFRVDLLSPSNLEATSFQLTVKSG